MSFLKSVLFLIILFVTSSLWAGEVLIIESNHSTDRWDSGYLKALNKVHGRRHNISYFEMNAKRLPASLYAKQAEAAWDAYQRIKPDYVILGDDVAIDHLGKRFAKENIPVIFLGADKNPRHKFKNNKYPSNVTGVLERPLIRNSAAELKKILPHMKRMLVLLDHSDASKYAIDQGFYRVQNISGVSVEIMLIATLERWQRVVNSAKSAGYDAVIIGHHSNIIAKNNVKIPANAIMTWTSQALEVPLFAFWDRDVGIGKAAGGLVVDGYEQGRIAARLLIQIASGQTPLGAICRHGKLAFSETELRRWKISLPEHMHSRVKLYD
ncbi:MAG: ABC transporter substrate-binding protein [Methyloligellaceae bacterium]